MKDKPFMKWASIERAPSKIIKIDARIKHRDIERFKQRLLAFEHQIRGGMGDFEVDFICRTAEKWYDAGTDDELMSIWAKEEEPLARASVTFLSSNPDILKMLAKDENKIVREAAIAKLERISALV